MIANDYSSPVEVAKGIYWVGFADENAGLHCNPYLIVDGEEAILIDGGSRGDFSTVMMKILQTGIDPKWIRRLIYQHYDPDLCGSISHLENLIDNDDLKIISHRENNIFIKYYSSTKPKLCIETIGYRYVFESGRTIEFYRTPYAHSTGSFVSYDTKTGTLFSSDLFGSYDRKWDLYLDLDNKCYGCTVEEVCQNTGNACVVKGILNFHQRVMTSYRSLSYAMEVIESIKPRIIAPQHGSIIIGERKINYIISCLLGERDIGIDWYLNGGDSGGKY